MKHFKHNLGSGSGIPGFWGVWKHLLAFIAPKFILTGRSSICLDPRYGILTSICLKGRGTFILHDNPSPEDWNSKIRLGLQKSFILAWKSPQWQCYKRSTYLVENIKQTPRKLERKVKNTNEVNNDVNKTGTKNGGAVMSGRCPVVQ